MMSLERTVERRRRTRVNRQHTQWRLYLEAAGAANTTGSVAGVVLLRLIDVNSRSAHNPVNECFCEKVIKVKADVAAVLNSLVLLRAA